MSNVLTTLGLFFSKTKTHCETKNSRGQPKIKLKGHIPKSFESFSVKTYLKIDSKSLGKRKFLANFEILQASFLFFFVWHGQSFFQLYRYRSGCTGGAASQSHHCPICFRFLPKLCNVTNNHPMVKVHG